MSALSASKQKRLAAKAAKKSSAASSPATTNGRNTPLPPNADADDNDDSVVDTLIPGLSAMDIAKKKGGDRTCTGVLTSQVLSRDIKIESFSLSFHGRELISNTDIDLNFGRRYGLIGANGSGKSTFLECLANREVPIPEHIDVSLNSLSRGHKGRKSDHFVCLIASLFFFFPSPNLLFSISGARFLVLGSSFFIFLFFFFAV